MSNKSSGKAGLTYVELTLKIFDGTLLQSLNTCQIRFITAAPIIKMCTLVHGDHSLFFVIESSLLLHHCWSIIHFDTLGSAEFCSFHFTYIFMFMDVYILNAFT